MNLIEIYTSHFMGLRQETKLYNEPELLETELTKEDIKRFESGELINACIIVITYSKSGLVEGTDSMGQCYLRSDYIEDDVRDLKLLYGLSKNSYDDLIVNLKRVRDTDLTVISGGK